MTRALGAALLGGLMSAAASGFDEPSLYVAGLALLLLGVGSWLWVGLASQGAGITRMPGPATVDSWHPPRSRCCTRWAAVWLVAWMLIARTQPV